MTASGGPEEVAARYLTHLTVEGAKALAKKIREHRAVGVTDEQGFRERRAARRTAEFATYKRYVSDRLLRDILINGIVLRNLEIDPKGQPRIEDIRGWLREHLNTTAVRQAEFAQRGMLLRAIHSLEESGASLPQARLQIDALLRNVEKHTRWVREDDSPKSLGDELRIRVLETTPNTFIVFGKGRARDIAKEGVRIALKALPSNYRVRPMADESKYDYVALIGESDNGSVRIRWWGGPP